MTLRFCRTKLGVPSTSWTSKVLSLGQTHMFGKLLSRIHIFFFMWYMIIVENSYFIVLSVILSVNSFLSESPSVHIGFDVWSTCAEHTCVSNWSWFIGKFCGTSTCQNNSQFPDQHLPSKSSDPRGHGYNPLGRAATEKYHGSDGTPALSSALPSWTTAAFIEIHFERKPFPFPQVDELVTASTRRRRIDFHQHYYFRHRPIVSVLLLF